MSDLDIGIFWLLAPFIFAAVWYAYVCGVVNGRNELKKMQEDKRAVEEIRKKLKKWDT